MKIDWKHIDIKELAAIVSEKLKEKGIDSLIVAGMLYVLVSGLKILAAYWIYNARMDGAILELILLGLSAILWYGFALPLGPLLGVVQIVLLALTWRTMS